MKALLVFFGALAAAVFAQDQPRLVWEGEVDGTVVIHVRNNRLDIEERTGAPVQRDRHRFYERLPELRQDVQVQVLQGRGRVRTLQQPRPDNNYTLSIQIEDYQGGQSFYSLAMGWRSSGRSEWPGSQESRDLSPSRPPRSLNRGEERLTWTGRVDDEVIVECRASDCRSRELRGVPVSRDRVQFTQPVPDRDIRVTLDDIQGRGEVQLIENPSPSNNYTARVRIRDTAGGSADYGFSLYWMRPRDNEPGRLFARPGAVWKGRVDGVVRVTVAGANATSEVRGGAPVQEENSHFERALPYGDSPNASVRKIRGRGHVEIVEFPSSRNRHRLVFEINDSSGGSDYYEVEVGW
jgi:hypothetical protein